MKRFLNKKLTRLALLALVALLLTASFAACKAQDKQLQTGNLPSALDMVPTSEDTMQNFLNKLVEGNYVIDAAGYLKTVAASRDLVYFDYADDEIYSDFAIMSVGGESFRALLNGNSLDEILYLGEGQAIDAASEYLPNIWMSAELSDGNIWNLFYNNPMDPLEFVSNSAAVKNSIRMFVGYGENAVRLMHDVYFRLDREDPTAVRITAEVDDDAAARISYDDIDLVISFGKAKTDARAEAWMKNPVYPEPRTAWNESDLLILNSVFLNGYGETALPFADFATYAFIIDGENFVADDEVSIRDSKATAADLEQYIAKLLENGFEKVAEDGEVFYRLLLRPEYRCYSSISLEYDNGINLVAKKYYDNPVYEGLGSINAALGKAGFVRLPETEVLTDFSAIDSACEDTEGWLYFYEYDLYLHVIAKFADEEAVIAYFDAYIESLGYTPVYEDGEEAGATYYRSANGAKSFRYRFNDAETVELLFKSDKYLTPGEMSKRLRAAGFPTPAFDNYDSCRDRVAYWKAQFGEDFTMFLAASFTFETFKEGEAFLDAYAEALTEAGFEEVSPEEIESGKPFAFLNREKGLEVAIQFSGEIASIDFRIK